MSETLSNNFEMPSFSKKHNKNKKEKFQSIEELQSLASELETILEDFGVRGEIINVRSGPVVTLFELEPVPGTKSSRVIGLADDLARAMQVISVRISPIAGRNAIGIELPNKERQNILLSELFTSPDFAKNTCKLPIVLGKDIGGNPVIVDLAKMPHLALAGVTGSGKSVAMNAMILSLLKRFNPEECRFIMIDPKMLELSIYEGIPHLLTPVITDPKKAVLALQWAVREMEERYKKMRACSVRNIEGYNAHVKEAALKSEEVKRQQELDLTPLPYIVIIVDEMADVMMVAGQEVEQAVQRLAQMARAAGIHLIMATQRISVDILTPTIKASFPTRISFQVKSKIDSRTILGEMGAEHLLGNSDMLYMAGSSQVQRIHGAFVSEQEIETVIADLKLNSEPKYMPSPLFEEFNNTNEAAELGDEEGETEAVYHKAVYIVLRDNKPLTPYIQRQLGIGYNQAASFIDRMEEEAIISLPNEAGKRVFLLDNENHSSNTISANILQRKIDKFEQLKADMDEMSQDIRTLIKETNAA